ncbi:hypothetical protein ACFSTJ_19155 [Ottowia pentelensis]|uniref:hypothetical protein n=1 Tax=Ottowia pentelensis TaxID=511108 RepID=UPI00362F62C5
MNVRPASGHDPARAPVLAPADAAAGGGAAAAKPMTEAERINARTEASQRDRRRDELEHRGVPSADAAVGATRRNCRAEMARLESERGTANNNLAGATFCSRWPRRSRRCKRAAPPKSARAATTISACWPSARRWAAARTFTDAHP